jgi:hypothetical protein
MIKTNIATGRAIDEESFEYDGPLVLAQVGSVNGNSGDNYDDEKNEREFGGDYDLGADEHVSNFKDIANDVEKSISGYSGYGGDGDDDGNSGYDLGAAGHISNFKDIVNDVDRSMSEYFGSFGSSNKTDLSVKGFLKSVLHGVSYSFYMAGRDIFNLAVNGPPPARVALGIAGVSIAAPGIAVLGSTSFYVSNAPTITSIMGQSLKCQPTLTQGIQQGYREAQRYFND